MIAPMRAVTPEERVAQSAANTATPEQKHWFWTAGSRVAHRFAGSWFEPGPAGRWDKALCGAGPAVWPAYCGCPEHPEDRPHCKRCSAHYGVNLFRSERGACSAVSANLSDSPAHPPGPRLQSRRP